LSRLIVSFEKLGKYANSHGGFELLREEDKSGNNETIILSFVPSFPEALEKGDSTPPRVIMTGNVQGDKVEFNRVQIEDSLGLRDRDIEESELVYKSWLEYIEENY
jgi:hypothetical protein